MAIIYGIDTQHEVSPEKVRDAIAQCFSEAHAEALKDSLGGEGDDIVLKASILETVKKAFVDTGGDFDAPTKASLEKALESLRAYAGAFRDQTIIQKHYAQIMELMSALAE